MLSSSTASMYFRRATEYSVISSVEANVVRISRTSFRSFSGCVVSR